MIPVAEAKERILALMPLMGTENVALEAAHSRVLAEDIVAEQSQPPFAAAAMDGYAVAESQAGQSFTVIAETAAGEARHVPISGNEAVRIFTGAPLPEGAQRVIIQEDVEREGDRITLRQGADNAAYIRPAGFDFRVGQQLLAAPKRLVPADIALLAAANRQRVSVYKRPRIALLPTGNELIWPGGVPDAGQIVSSNNFGLAAMIEALGGEPLLLPIARDNLDDLLRAIESAEGADMLITLGGASVGDHDLVHRALRKAGAKLIFHRIAMRPGKPLMAGKLGPMPLLGFPGNPVSAMVCGRVFLRPAFQVMTGQEADEHMQLATLASPLPENGPRAHYMRARVETAEGKLICQPFASQDSSRLYLLAQANALAVRAPHAPVASAGDSIHVLPLSLNA